MQLDDVLNIWGPGQILSFSGIDGTTDYDEGIIARTSFSNTGIELKTPGKGNICFSDSKPEFTLLAGDFFVIKFSDKTIKFAFIDAYHILIEGECSINNMDDSYEILQKDNKTLIGRKTKFNTSFITANIDTVISNRQQWLKNITILESLSSSTTKTLAKALSMMKNQVYTPEGQIKTRWTSPDKWPHKMMWLWDSVFHAIGIRHIDPELAKDAINAVLSTQHKNGMISHCMCTTTSSKITQPPVLAFGVKLVNEMLNGNNWIKEVYPKLCRYIQWDIDNRDTDGSSLVEWDIEDNKVCRSGESGMDNSPRFDSATQLDATDFNSFLALECEILAEFADALCFQNEKAYWEQKHTTICNAINSILWNEDSQFYVDFDLSTQKQSPILASSGFLPLICGAPSPAQASALVEHLNNPKTFKTPLPVPSISQCSKPFYSKDMWRGPVWININWLIAYGLARYGFKKEADKLLKQTTDAIEKEYNCFGTIFEFYDDQNEATPPALLRKGTNVNGSSYNQVIHDYGWSATLYTDIIYSQKS